MSLRIRLLTLASTCLMACPAPEDTSPPPLFNAVDPSVQCPAGQIGWDFSTGGLGEVLRNSVGKAVKVIDATLGAGCGLTAAELRAQCDGQESCPKAVTCDDDAVNVTYVCGTETPVYHARVEGTGGDRKLNLVCGLPITIKKATYAPDAPAPADITAALAARCSGKRRCANGASGWELNAYQDPLPNVRKTVEVRYACGGEATEFVQTLDDAKLDFACGLEERPVLFREPIHIVSARPRLPPQSSHQANVQAIVQRHLDRIRAACEGKLACDFPVDTTLSRDESTSWWQGSPQQPGTWGELGWQQRGAQRLIVNYSCGTGTLENEKVFSLYEPKGSLKCGEPFVYDKAEEVIVTCRTYSGVQQCTKTYRDLPALTAAMKTRCDGRRVCYAPGFDGRTNESIPRNYGKLLLPDGGYLDVGGGAVRHSITCGSFSPQSSQEIDHGAAMSGGESSKVALECPVFDPGAVTKGIRVADVTPADQTLAITKRCFGTDTCDVGTAQVKYRCGNSPTVLTSQNGKAECRPAITITKINACAYTPPANWCQFSPGTCDYHPSYTPNAANYGCSSITVSYTCGPDPTVKTATATPTPPYNKPLTVPLSCPTLPTPYVRKECVPTYCYGSTRRDDNLQCVTDTTLVPTVSVQFGSIANWQEGPDGGTSRFGSPLPRPADGVYPLKSDFPYQVFTSTYYKADNNKPLPDTTTATVWAYDQFELADGGTPNPAVFGFRCFLGESMLKGAAVPSNIAGYQAAVMGGKGSAIPSTCFDQSGYNDERSSTFDAARSVGLEESTFRTRYRFKQSWVVSSFDAHGKASTRRFGAVAVAPNPIGFFYDPRRDWVNSLGYYAQRGDFSRAYKVRFEPSTEIELAAIDESVDAPDLLVDVEKPDLLPGFDVNFAWYQRGSSSLNPYFQENKVANNPVQSLDKRNLRVTVEMARADSALANPWEPSNSVRFPSQPVGPGISLFRKTERVHVDFTPELRRRLLTVRGNSTSTTPASPDGFMSDFADDDTAFLVRTCLDLDGLDRAVGDTAIDNKTLPAASGYTAKISRRCSAPRTVVVRRQLFVRPVMPMAAEETPNDKGAMAGNGDRDVGGGNDNGSQVGCIRNCTVDADCGNAGVCTPGPNGTIGRCERTPDNAKCSTDNRSQQGSGGQFPLTMYSARSTSSTEQTSSTTRAASDQTTGKATASAEMFSFTTFAPTSSSASVTNTPTKRELEVKISPNLQPIIDAFKGKKMGVFSTDAKKVLMQMKKSGKSRGAGEVDKGADGLGFAVGREFYFLLGPVPLVVEVGLSAGLGFELELKAATEKSEIGQSSSAYPCLNGSSSRCFTVETTPKTFADAQRACQLQGGRLAPIITPGDLSAVDTQLAAADPLPDGSAVADGEVWLGGQTAYNYAYGPCASNGGRWVDGSLGAGGTFSSQCKQNSATGFFWLTGQRFAGQTGLSSAITANSLRDNGFPSTLTLPASRVPAKAGVTYRKSPFQVSTQPQEAALPYVCEFDPATSVITQSNDVGFTIEASIGLGAAVCLPSNRVGICLAAELKFVSLALAFEAGSENTSVFSGLNTARRLRTTIGKTTNKGGAELSFISGGLAMQLRFLFWTKSFDLKTFGPAYKKEWPFYENENPYFKETP